jgi:HSP20 family molecular chaperone IbpA
MIMRHYVVTRNDAKSLFDEFNDFFKPAFSDEIRDMKTNICESEDGYRLDIEMPGFQKDQINVALEDGYLTVSGEKHSGTDEKYLRKEISESFSRSYYVGKDISEEYVKAKYDNGILSLSIPKSQPKQVTTHSIAIE